MGWYLMSITMGYIKGNLPKSKSEFNFPTATVVFSSKNPKKPVWKKFNERCYYKAVTIILEEKQNFTINPKILIIKHNLYCCILEEG